MHNIKYIEARNLYRKETYEHSGVGFIEVLFPVLDTGDSDPMRFPIFIGSTILQSGNQQIQVKFKLPKATKLEEAIDQWGLALEEAILEVETQQRRQAILNATPNGRPVP